EDGTVWAWGQNSEGEIGDGRKRTFQSKPIQVKGLKDIIFISASTFSSAALRRDGTVWVWGRHHLDQIGSPSGAKEYSELPIQVKGIPPAVAIACGQKYSFVVDQDGFVWFWGWDQNSPKKIKGLKLF
ncbi:MAG: hypothetical protein N3B16_12395, partial [Candidatus Aminicenantes bacterium]|nr:hypothetical protein [Candidatus Aminicenantes bacterium]